MEKSFSYFDHSVRSGIVIGFVFLGAVMFSHQNSKGQESRSFSIVGHGDTQFSHLSETQCLASRKFRADQNLSAIQAFNTFFENPGVIWPDTKFSGDNYHRSGKVFRRPKFLIMAGDLTESGDSFGCNEWSQFEYHFPAAGVLGSVSQLSYPSFETSGNHDFPFVPTREDALSENATKFASRRIQARHPSRSQALSAINGRDIELIAQSKDRGAYAWKYDDIHFFNLNVKPSGGGRNKDGEKLKCGKDTNKSHINDPDDLADIPRAVADNKCIEYIVKHNSVRAIHPNYPLSFLQENLVKNSQVVVTTHYGPKSQSRISNDELKNFCTILRNKRVRLVAWLVGHTHKSDYYEWSCGGYTVPVINVGSGFYSNSLNGHQVHFSLIRFGERWLEAVDVSYDPESQNFRVPGRAVSIADSCENARGNMRYPEGHDKAIPYNLKKHAIYDKFNSNNNPGVGKWCNPDGKLGGWQVRAPLCPHGEKPYLGKSGLDKNPKCS